MRRYIAYLALSAAMLVASGAAIAPTVLKMDADLAYADGQTLYFKASLYEAESTNGNYGVVEQDGSLTFLGETDVDNAGEYIVSDIAATMRERLDTWGISEYEVRTQGYDTIAVSLRTPYDASITYSQITDYLSFAGQDYELDASNTTADSSDEDGAYNHNDRWETLLDGQVARIEEIDMNSYSVPVVVMPIASGTENKDAFLKLLEYCANNTTAAETDENGEVTKQAVTCSVVLWADRTETDKYEDRGTNPLISAKVVGEWNASGDQCVWYASDDTDKANPQFQMIPSSAAITSEGQYDPNQTKAAYEAAVYLRNKLNASNYSYKNAAGIDTRYSVSFLYSEPAAASVENFAALGDWTLTLASTRTLWSIVAIIGVMAVVLAFFERMLAFHHVANVMVVGVSSLLLFSAMGAQFNIASLLALAAVSLVTLFGSLIYSRRLKDEMYKGRTLKKANQEAAKRTVLPIVDAGVITAVFGVFLYALGGDIASKAGVMLVIGGLLSIAANLILTRLQFWLLSNDSTFPSHVQHWLGIHTDKVPNLAEEEKQSYFGPYAERDFTKGKKIASIAMGVLLLAGMGTMIGFGVANNGDVYNDAAYQGGGTVLRIDVRTDSSDNAYVLAYSESGKIYNADAAENTHDDVFHQYTIDGKTLAELTANFNIASSKTVYTLEGASDKPTEYHWYYYEAELSAKLDEENHVIQVWNGTSFVDAGYTSLYDLAESMVGGNEKNLVISFKQVSSATMTPYLWQIALGLGIGFAVNLVYMVIRYRPSRGIAATVLAMASSYLGVAFFVITRISTSPIVALGAIPVAIVGMLLGLFALNDEKNIYRDSREKEKNTLAFRSECLDLALARNADSTITYFLVAWLFAILALFGPIAYFNAHLSMVIGLAFALMASLVLLVPGSKLLAGLFAKIKFKPRKKKKKSGGQLMKKRSSAEPEEAIFIGIND